MYCLREPSLANRAKGKALGKGQDWIYATLRKGQKERDYQIGKEGSGAVPPAEKENTEEKSREKGRRNPLTITEVGRNSRLLRRGAL